MKRNLKKAFAALLLLTLLTAGAVGVTITANAASPALYHFDTWTGSGPASVSIKTGDASLAGLTYDGEEVVNSNYTVTKAGDNSILTLKEEYLKASEFKNGEYSFWADFYLPGMLKPVYAGIDPTGKNQVVFSGTDPSKFVKLTYHDEEIDSSNYTVAATKGGTVVTINEEYLETLTLEYSFAGYFSEDYYRSVLKLTVEIAPTAPSVSTDPATMPTAASKPEAPVRGNPKTGQDDSAVAFLLIMLLSVTSFSVVLFAGRSKNVI